MLKRDTAVSLLYSILIYGNPIRQLWRGIIILRYFIFYRHATNLRSRFAVQNRCLINIFGLKPLQASFKPRHWRLFSLCSNASDGSQASRVLISLPRSIAKGIGIKPANLISGKRDTVVSFCYDKRDTAVSTFHSSCCFISVWRNTSADFLETSFLGRRTLRVRSFSRFPLHKKTTRNYPCRFFMERETRFELATFTLAR